MKDYSMVKIGLARGKELFLLAFLLFGMAVSSYALNSFEDLQRDFAPLQGLLIGTEDGLFVLDKGRAQGVKPKDIFTVYKRTKKIIHPETKESLGFLKDPVGKLEIIRVEENFSVARLLRKREDFTIPAMVRRNAEIKIYLISPSPELGEAFYFLLKDSLPDGEIKLLKGISFQQLDPATLNAERVDYLIQVGEEVIKVYNSDLEPIKAYGSKLALIKEKTKASVPSTSLPQPLSKPQTLGFVQVQTLGKMPGEVLQAEFADIDGDAQPEMIYLTPEELQIVKIKGGLLTRYKPSRGRPIYLSVGAKGWIALNIYEPNLKMRSQVLRFTHQGLQPVIQEVNLFLQFVDYAGTGQKDTLVGQTFSPETFFGREVYLLKREQDRIVYGLKLEVSDNFRLLGAVRVDLDGDGEGEWISYLPDGRLAVFKRNLLQYSSPFPVAKHFFSFNLTAGKKGSEVIKGTFYPYPTPILTSLDGKPAIVYFKTEFPLEAIAKDLKRIPLNQATFQVQTLQYQGNYYFRNLTDSETGLPTGLGILNEGLYLTKITGEYPGRTETVLNYR